MNNVNTKTVVAIMLVALIIGLSPACAMAASTNYQTADPMNVKGKGVDAEAASEILEQSDGGQASSTDNGTSNTTNELATTDSELSNATTDPAITPEIGQIIETIDNQTTTDETPEINTTGIVMQTTTYTCGPAALATVLNNMGINATEQELMNFAGTDENGTTMYGLAEAAKAKGLNAGGMKLPIDDLKPNNIVFITVNGGPHYSVVREVTNESVKLADPSLGNIEMSKEKFAEVYSGNALVISDPNVPALEVSNLTQVNGTTEQTSNGADTNSTSAQADNSKTLTKDEMQSIKGKHRTLEWKHVTWWEFGWYYTYYAWQWVYKGVRYIKGFFYRIYSYEYAPVYFLGWHKHEWRFV